ncbi:hypothetical protein ABBQ32_005518 [Trebouxia sp. C0010 RCD-2024]
MELVDHSAGPSVRAARSSRSATAAHTAGSCCRRFAFPPVLLSPAVQSSATGSSTGLKLEGHSASLSNFEKQDNLANALLHPRPVRAAADKMDGGQADYTSPDRHHYLAPAASDAAPRWSEQKLLHKMAKEARSLATTSSSIRQKLFDSTLQGFAAAEEQLNRAYPASTGSPAQGLLLPGPPETVRSNKRKDCMPLKHSANKKPRHSSGSSMIPRGLAFDAAEKAMQNSVIRSSEE